MRRFAQFLLLTTLAVLCSAHIGSPDAWYHGPAGPYQVLVHVRTPVVVPGIAVVSIKPEGVVDSITAFVNKYDAVTGGPPADIAKPVPNSPGWFETDLWVMSPGSNSVTVTLRGTHGEGSVVVPLVAVAARRLQFDGPLSIALGAAALVLVAGLLTLVGAAVRESVLPPGEQPDASRRRRARFAMLRAAVVILVVVGALGAWWSADDAAFQSSLYRPLNVSATTESMDGNNRLIFTITDSAWRYRNNVRWLRARGGPEFTSLMEDHGKLVHMFVISENGRSTFAHLHPATEDTVIFRATLPPLPAGRYRVFADVLHTTGFAQTLSANFEIAAPDKNAIYVPGDADDAFVTGVAPDSGSLVTLADGTTAVWPDAGAKHVAGQEANLRFRFTPIAGDSGRLEPYMGMQGHAAVVRDDGAVFIHLHPMGTISVGAQTVLARSGGPTHNMPAASMGNELYFPYAFPEPGNYTVWVQLKRNGKVLTGAWRVRVQSAGARTS